MKDKHLLGNKNLAKKILRIMVGIIILSIPSDLLATKNDMDQIWVERRTGTESFLKPLQPDYLFIHPFDLDTRHG